MEGASSRWYWCKLRLPLRPRPVEMHSRRIFVTKWHSAWKSAKVWIWFSTTEGRAHRPANSERPIYEVIRLRHQGKTISLLERVMLPSMPPTHLFWHPHQHESQWACTCLSIVLVLLKYIWGRRNILISLPLKAGGHIPMRVADSLSFKLGFPTLCKPLFHDTLQLIEIAEHLARA